MAITIRKGTAADVPDILHLIKELAAFEMAPEQVTVTEEELIKDGFSDEKVFDVLIADYAGQVAGMSLYFTAYSTWKGKMVYLDDLIVSEPYRGKGIGKLLLDETIKLAKESGAKLMKWQALDWNTPAIDFYKTYGAEFDDEWVNVKLMID